VLEVRAGGAARALDLALGIELFEILTEKFRISIRKCITQA